jgi:nucleoporin POM152
MIQHALMFSTAKLNPLAKSFCLEPPEHVSLIPIVFNNTHPTHISYSISPLGDDGARMYVNLSSRELRQIEKVRSDALVALEQADPDEGDDTDDDFDYNEPPRQRALSRGSSPDLEYRLEKTEVLQHIKVSRPGVVRLERALDQANTQVRIRPTEVTVVHCPKVEFVAGGSKDDEKRCVGTTEALDLKLYGVAPLSLKWHRDVAGRREHFLVEGIEGNHTVSHIGVSSCCLR